MPKCIHVKLYLYVSVESVKITSTSITMNLLIIFLGFVNFYFVQSVDNPNILSTSFCYDDPTCGPSTWTGLCKTGKQQSPIDIEVPSPSLVKKFFQPMKTIIKHLVTGTTNLLLSLTNSNIAPNEDIETTSNKYFYLNDIYERRDNHTFYAQNNGHSVQFEFTPNISALESNLTISGGKLLDTYVFAQMHFHWGKHDNSGSEHTIDKIGYPMELHMVHYRKGYKNLADALLQNDREAVAVMAVLFEIGKENNTGMIPVVEAVTHLLEPFANATKFNMRIQISALYPKVKENKGSIDIATYLGSLTTPTCDEKVIWTVFLHPVLISEYQMLQFRNLRNAEDVSDYNNRPTQDLNGREVEFYIDV